MMKEIKRRSKLSRLLDSIKTPMNLLSDIEVAKVIMLTTRIVGVALILFCFILTRGELLSVVMRQ